MTKLDVILLAMLLASSLLAVNNAYESRRVFSELDRARQVQVQLDAEFKRLDAGNREQVFHQHRAAQLDAEFKRLDAERQAQGTHLLVEKAAREKLKMRTASPAVTAYVFDAAASEGAR